jgi:hypothetical protein
MSIHEPRWVCDAQPTAEEVTTAASYLGDYDDGSLGCEAMIGGLETGIRCFRLRYEAN